MSSKWGRPSKRPEDATTNAQSYIVEALQSAWLELYLIDAGARRRDAELYLFCHIPKCAGTKIVEDFRSLHKGTCLTYSFVRQAQFWVSKWQRVNDKIDLAEKVLSVKSLFIHGHIPLYLFRRSGLDQKAKILFTTLRGPTEIIQSHVNYILTCIDNYPGRPDSKNWIERFSQEGLDLVKKKEKFTHDHARLVLHSRYFRKSYSNLISKFLLPESLLASPENFLSHIYSPAECRLVPINQLELVYASLGLEKPASSRVNQSIKYLDVERLGNLDISYIKTCLLNHDLPLWDLIGRHLYCTSNQGASLLEKKDSIEGMQLASKPISTSKSRIHVYIPISRLDNTFSFEINTSMHSSGAAIRYAMRVFGCEDRQKAYLRFKNFHVKTIPGYEIDSGWEQSGFFDYVYPVSKLLRALKSGLYVPVVTHDNTSEWDRPVIAKTRRSRSDNITLMKLSERRHWEKTLKACRDENPFQLKKDILLFRGATTGKSWLKYPANDCDIKRLSPRCLLYHFLKTNAGQRLEALGVDMGFNKITTRLSAGSQGFHESDFDDCKKETTPLQDILDCRYQLVLEGNDVSTGLKAVLASQCVPLMPAPTTESWLLEFDLKPWVHFVPVNPDLSDLIQRLSFLRANPLDAEAIALAGRSYMRKFLNDNREKAIQLRVLKRFIKNYRSYLIGLRAGLGQLLDSP